MLTKFLYSQSIKKAMNIVQQIYIAPLHYGHWRAKDIDQSAGSMVMYCPHQDCIMIYCTISVDSVAVQVTSDSLRYTGCRGSSSDIVSFTFGVSVSHILM